MAISTRISPARGLKGLGVGDTSSARDPALKRVEEDDAGLLKPLQAQSGSLPIPQKSLTPMASPCCSGLALISGVALGLPVLIYLPMEIEAIHVPGSSCDGGEEDRQGNL